MSYNNLFCDNLETDTINGLPVAGQVQTLEQTVSVTFQDSVNDANLTAAPTNLNFYRIGNLVTMWIGVTPTTVAFNSDNSYPKLPTGTIPSHFCPTANVDTPMPYTTSNTAGGIYSNHLLIVNSNGSVFLSASDQNGPTMGTGFGSGWGCGTETVTFYGSQWTWVTSNPFPPA